MKVFLSGIVAGVVMLVVNNIMMILFSVAMPSLATEYMTPMFRPWSDPLMSLIYAAPFILGIVLAYVWNAVKTLFKGSAIRNGVKLGVFYWLLTISGMVMTYSSFQITFAMVASWSIIGLVQTVCGGIVLAKLNK